MVLLQAECSALLSFQLQRQGMHSFCYHRCKLVSMSFLDRKGPAFGPQISLQEQSPPSLPLNRALSAGQDGFPASGHEGATAARPVLAVREEQSSRCGPQSGRLFSYSNAVECRGTEETCAHLWNPSEPAAGVLTLIILRYNWWSAFLSCMGVLFFVMSQIKWISAT